MQDHGAGIHRVVRELKKRFEIDKRFEVSFVGWREDNYYIIENNQYGTKCSPQANDIFLALDFSPIYTNHAVRGGIFAKYKDIGVKFHFLIHDIIPMKYPQFNPFWTKIYTEFFNNALKYHKVIHCVSNSTKNDVNNWCNDNGLQIPNLDYFHLGSDIVSTKTDIEINFNSTAFLMVGTVEPRKGHRIVLTAFEKMWKQGLDLNLIIVGKTGWNLEDLWEKIGNHPQRNKRLFWYHNADDNMLLSLYQNCDCLIMASEAEGFGLPLIEASKYNLPIIARDIPVFREICEDNASYFSDENSLDIFIANWTNDYNNGKYIDSSNLKSLTWDESYNLLVKKIYDHTK